MSKKKGIKKEHLLIGGAGALALIYILSRGKGGGAPGFGGGGLGDVPGLETITTETITIPAGASDVGGSILLPPPEAGRFFDVPDWVRPDPGSRERPFTKKEEMIRGVIADDPKHVAYREALGVSEEPPLTIGGYIAPGGVYDPYVAPGGVYDPYVAEGWGKPVSKKEAIISKPVSLFESMPGSGFVVGAKRLKSFLGGTFF